MLVRTWRNWKEACALLVGMQMVRPLWETVWRWCLKKLTIELHTIQAAPTSRYTSEITQGKLSKGYLYTHVRSSILPKSQKVEAPKCLSKDERIGKMWCILHTMDWLFCLKKKENSDTYYNMDEPWEYFVKWKKLVKERQVLYDCTYIRHWG